MCVYESYCFFLGNLLLFYDRLINLVIVCTTDSKFSAHIKALDKLSAKELKNC